MPKVSIVCTAYNHAPYITRTLEGFVMQRCNFAFEVVVHDDASTDNTAAIVSAFAAHYPHMFRLVLQNENQYSKGADIWGRLFSDPLCGEYIAICEGDDYWTDPDKLQKQIDFLDTHSDYLASYGKVVRFYDRIGKFKEEFGSDYVSFEHLLAGNTVPTPTVVFRRDAFLAYQQTIRPTEQGWKMGDYPLWLWFAANGKMQFINSELAVYRVLERSASHFERTVHMRMFQENTEEIALFFARRYQAPLEPIEIELLWIQLEIAARKKDKKRIREIARQVGVLRSKYRSVKLPILCVGGYCPGCYLAFLKIFRSWKSLLN